MEHSCWVSGEKGWIWPFQALLSFSFHCIKCVLFWKSSPGALEHPGELPILRVWGVSTGSGRNQECATGGDMGIKSLWINPVSSTSSSPFTSAEGRRWDLVLERWRGGRLFHGRTGVSSRVSTSEIHCSPLCFPVVGFSCFYKLNKFWAGLCTGRIPLLRFSLWEYLFTKNCQFGKISSRNFDDPALFQRVFLHCYAGFAGLVLVFIVKQSCVVCSWRLTPCAFMSRNLVPELTPKCNCDVMSLLTHPSKDAL